MELLTSYKPESVIPRTGTRMRDDMAENLLLKCDEFVYERLAN